MSKSDWLEKDYYQVLGVDKDADADVVKKAYRKLARENHPDSKPGDAKAEDRFKAVSEAYSVLSDPAKRKEYDDTRSMFGAGAGGFRMPRGGGGTTFDLGDLFGNRGTSGAGAGGIGDLLGDIFSGGNARRTNPQPRRGADVESQATIAFREAVDGITLSLRMTSEAACRDCSGTGARSGTVPTVCVYCQGTGMQATSDGGPFAMTEPCPHCRGRGLVVADPCPTCNGSGRGVSTRTLQARIPAGVKDGQRIRLRGKGAPGERGGPAGDLYVVVHVTPHPVFGRAGDNITLAVPITFDEAALGASVKVPTLSGGAVTLKVPAGTPNGRTFRVRGRGATRKDGTKGDLLVTVDVVVPEELSAEARAAVETLRSHGGGADPRAGLFTKASG
ncbi:MAG: molecular chaperone DnaJ [Nocardioidaceae bacterium]